MGGSGSKKIEKDANASINYENQNVEIQIEENTSSGNKDQCERLGRDIRKTIERSLSSTEYRIYKVPYDLRKWKEDAYTPKVISIGPFHHGNRRLAAMEEHKVRYFKSYLDRTGVSVEYLISFIGAQEKIIRSCYREYIDFSSDEFVKMILLDASFILELFLTSADPTSEPWLWRVRLDLVLLENQLPFFVIEGLHDIAFPGLSNSSPIELAHSFLLKGLNIEAYSLEYSNLNIEHLTDLLRTSQLPQRLPRRVSRILEISYSATQLQQAGIKFRKSSSNCLVKLKLKDNVLEIPGIELDVWKQTIFRNIIALEQVRYVGEEYITDYFAMLGSLIHTTKDWDLLCHKKIMVNHPRDINADISLFKNLCNGLIYASQSRHYNLITLRLNRFYLRMERPWRTKLRTWINTLKRDYFRNPWKSTATLTAIILLVLTFIQTVCSIRK